MKFTTLVILSIAMVKNVLATNDKPEASAPKAGDNVNGNDKKNTSKGKKEGNTDVTKNSKEQLSQPQATASGIVNTGKESSGPDEEKEKNSKTGGNVDKTGENSDKPVENSDKLVENADKTGENADKPQSPVSTAESSSQSDNEKKSKENGSDTASGAANSNDPNSSSNAAGLEPNDLPPSPSPKPAPPADKDLTPPKGPNKGGPTGNPPDNKKETEDSNMKKYFLWGILGVCVFGFIVTIFLLTSK